MVALLLSILVSASPVSDAEKHLHDNQLDQLAFDLSAGQDVPQDQQAHAAQLLVEGAQRALHDKDSLMAMQLAQEVLLHDKTNPAALQMLVELSLADKSFTQADRYADLWLAAKPDDVHAKLTRAQVALAEEDPARAKELTGPLLLNKSLKGDDRKQAESLDHQAVAALKKEENSDNELERVIAERLHKAAEQAADSRKRDFDQRESSSRVATADTGKVIIYGTTWCGYCARTRDYFRSRNVPFEDKDIESDSDAAAELNEKKRAAHIRSAGVPVVDVFGTIVQGYNPTRFTEILHKRGVESND
jgi:glutaredoxin